MSEAVTGRVSQKPPWLRKRLPAGGQYEAVRDLVHRGGLHTVCQEARCPNIWECYSRRTATFLIMGSRCTRNCGFCAVQHGRPAPVDPGEPARVAQAVVKMKLQYVVVTSVTRDDLQDGGAGYFAETIREIKKRSPVSRVEVLVPDFQGSRAALETVLASGPHVLNHNVETVPRLYATVRPEGRYRRSLELLRRSKEVDPSTPTKSGLMLGLGESDREIRETLHDLLEAGCSLLTLGQYLQPTRKHLPVRRFVPPEVFCSWKVSALKMGFAQVAAAPLVRSSYHAQEIYLDLNSGIPALEARAGSETGRM